MNTFPLLILREIDRRHPEPTLYPDDQLGLASIVSWWADTTTFIPAATLTTSIIGDGIPKEFIEDRIAFMKHDFSKAASARDLALNRQRMHAAMGLLADLLKDGRPFLLGRNLSAADLSAYHTLWFARKNGGAEAEGQLSYEPLLGWMDRVAASGQGKRANISAEEALAVARRAEPEPARSVSPSDPSGLKAKQPSRRSEQKKPATRSVARCGQRGRERDRHSPRERSCRRHPRALSALRLQRDCGLTGAAPMRILTNTTSPYARIARIGLAEKGFDLSGTQVLNPWADPPDLLALNTAARVPTLQLVTTACRSPRAC